jgi:hypothetical protein
MMELVFWTFVVTLPPLVVSVVAMIPSVLADLLAWRGWRRIAEHRQSQPHFHCVAPHVGRPESFGHGI